jgi:hypothetical protein
MDVSAPAVIPHHFSILENLLNCGVDLIDPGLAYRLVNAQAYVNQMTFNLPNAYMLQSLWGRWNLIP